MSIYATWLSFDGEDHDLECAAYVEDPPGSACYELSGSACSCGAWRRQPIVYEGSHVLPSDDDRRGGGLTISDIPSHVARDGRDDAPAGALKDWLRLDVWSVPSTGVSTVQEGEPYVAGGKATVVLTRPLVEKLRDTLTAWLERGGGEDA